MATRATVTIMGDLAIASWNLADGETGDPVSLAAFPDKTIQGVGAGSAALEGSNDKTNYSAMTDTSGTAIAVTGGALAVVKENPEYIRPVATGAVAVIIAAAK